MIRPAPYVPRPPQPFGRIQRAPNPHAHMPSYGMQCLRRGIATDAPLTRWELAGLTIRRVLATAFLVGRNIGIGMLIVTGCWTWRAPR